MVCQLGAGRGSFLEYASLGGFFAVFLLQCVVGRLGSLVT